MHSAIRSADFVEVVPAAPDDLPVIANLMELYIYDFSEFLPLELGPDGRFGYDRLQLYWSDPGRRAFLLRLDGKLAGFALVNTATTMADEPAWDMAEFFVLRGYRRRAVGRRAAHELWRRLPARWEIRVREENHAAQAFWTEAISAFTGRHADGSRVDKDGTSWLVFAFDATP